VSDEPVEVSEAATTGSGEASKAEAPHQRPVIQFKPGYRGVDPRRNPPASSLKELTDEHKQIIELMVHGLDVSGEVDGSHYEAGEPLPFREACRAVGAKLRRMREMYATPLFQSELNRQIAAQRTAERPKNLHVAKQIRDDEGDGSAATKTVRLKAIQSIEGRDGQASVNVQINNNQTNNTIQPGYVIKLQADEPSHSQPKTIDVTPHESVSACVDTDQG
jgi:hypothetical protein